MNIDGEPIWSQIPSNDLKYAVNTNWDLFEHDPTKTFYLRHNESWLKATAVNGPWQAAGKLPASFGKLPADANWTEVKAAVPGKALARRQAADGLRQPEAGGADSRSQQAELPRRRQYEAAVAVQHRERRVPHGPDRNGLLPRGRPLVLRAGLHGPLDVRHAEPAEGVRPAAARAPAFARARLRARHAAGGRSGAARAGAADGARQQEGAQGS